jgi:glycosyltransferase involved in cell wall biosynthesis
LPAAEPEHEGARLSKKQTDSLIFQIGQELTAEKRPLLESYHHALARRGQRVLVLSHMYPSRVQPGLGPFIHEQVSALRVNSGIDARVVCCTPFWFNTFHPLKIARAYRAYRKLFANLHWESHDGVPVLYLPYMVGGFFRHWLHYATYTSAILMASDWLGAHFDFDLIHAHTSYLDGTAARALSRKFDVPYLLTEHTGPFRVLTDNPLMRRKTVAALTDARKVFCVSSSLANDVRGVLPTTEHGKIEVLHNGVDTDLFYPPPAWTPNPAAPRFLSVISLDENKNPLLLLDAFRRLLYDVPGARLDIVGAGPLKDVLLEKIRTEKLGAAVTLLGFKTRSEVARLLREECDALVLSSNSETFGVVLIEALACGKPLVATDCGGPRDIVTNSAVGILCPVRDEQALYEALRQLTDKLSDYRADTIRRHAVENYDYYNLASRLAQEYEHLMG